MKKVLFFFIAFLIVAFVSCKENVTLSEATSKQANNGNLSLHKVTPPNSPKLGLWGVFFFHPYKLQARIDSFKTLYNSGIKYVSLAGFLSEECKLSGGLWNWNDLDSSYKVAKETIGFERVVFGIGKQLLSSVQWTEAEVDTFIKHCRTLTTPNEPFFNLDEPYWRNFHDHENIDNLPHILSKSLNIYLAEPYPDLISAEAMSNNKIFISYDNYPARTKDNVNKGLDYKNGYYSSLSLVQNKKLIPLLGIDRNYTDREPTGKFEPELRDEIYAAAPYSDEVWFYAYQEEPTFYLSSSLYPNFANLISFLQNLQQEYYGAWDIKFLTQYGETDAIPCPADYDGDGYADIAVKTDDGRWLIDRKINGFGSWDWQLSDYGDITAHPCPADYDGDGHADIAVKTDDGRWLIDREINGFGSWDWQFSGYGNSGAIPCPADYNKDGCADLSVKTNLGEWYIDYSVKDGGNGGFGSWDLPIYTGYIDAVSLPCPADYDGDGKADLAVKTNGGMWKIDRSFNGFGNWDWQFSDYGNSGAIPCPADYNKDGCADLSVKTNTGQWKINYSIKGSPDGGFSFIDITLTGYGDATSLPCPGDYDGDGYADLAVKTSDTRWLIDYYQINFDWFH